MTSDRQSAATAPAADFRVLVPTAAVVVLLAALTGLGQFAGNVYLPALPSVAQDLAIGLFDEVFAD